MTSQMLCVKHLKYTEKQRTDIEVATRQQSDSQQWFEERQYRITASKFGLVVKRKRQHTSLVNQLLYTSVSPSVLALQWGRQHECDVLQLYKEALNDGCTLLNAGLFVDECGYLGASPDSLVVDSSGKPVK